jgi:hypothetical protein
MLPSTRTVEAAHEFGYRSAARTASSSLQQPLAELERWMDADTQRTNAGELALGRAGDLYRLWLWPCVCQARLAGLLSLPPPWTLSVCVSVCMVCRGSALTRPSSLCGSARLRGRTSSSAAGGVAAMLASPRGGAAPPASPTPRHMAMRSSESALSATVRRYPTEVALSPATVRSSAETAAVLPAGLASGRTLPRTRTSSAAADFGYGLGTPTATTVTAPEVVEMRRIVERRTASRTTSSSIGSSNGSALGLGGDPFADTAESAYVSPYRTASAGLVPSSTVRSSSSAYESPLAFSSPRAGVGVRSGDRAGEDLFRVPTALAGTEIAEVVRDYRRTGGVLNSAGPLDPPGAPLETSADALLDRLKEEQWQRERKGHGASQALSLGLDSCPWGSRRACLCV